MKRLKTIYQISLQRKRNKFLSSSNINDEPLKTNYEKRYFQKNAIIKYVFK